MSLISLDYTFKPLSHFWLLRPHELQHTRLPCPSLSPEFAQTHMHWAHDAIQPSHPLSPISPLALNISQHQGLFQWVGYRSLICISIFILLNYDQCWGSLRLPGDQTSQSQRKSTLHTHWKDWCWSFNTLVTWCEEPTHWKRPWCWEGQRVRGEGGNREWDDWMISSTQWTWVWANSGTVKDRKDWSAAVHGVTKTWAWLSDWTTTTNLEWSASFFILFSSVPEG